MSERARRASSTSTSEDHKSIASTQEGTQPNLADMGVPFEALLPYGIMLVMFGITGAGLSTVRYYSNNKHVPRRGLDAWDRQMMDRDLRLTGVFREQTDKVEAPLGYDVNSKWKLEKGLYGVNH